MDSAAVDRLHRLILGLAVVMTGITAWFSSGYYAADEHYQVIVFAQQRLGEPMAMELPWEYAARIRSALLPSVAYVVIAIGRGIHADPSIIAFALRLMTALCALLAVRTFVRTVLDGVVPHLRRMFVLLSYFLWFLPYQHVRFSAETWSGILFLAALALVLRRSRPIPLLMIAGGSMGLCAQVKPVMLVPCAGMIAWMVLQRRDPRKELIPLLSSILLALVAGALVDRWFYGTSTLTLGRYLHLAISGDPAHTFETYPWYFYFAWVAKYAIWPMGLLMLAALVVLTFRSPRHWLVWCIWPCLIILSAIPHKELRFLFPLGDLVPLLMVLAWSRMDQLPSLRRLRPLARACAGVVAAVNIIAMVVCASVPAGSGRTRLAAGIPGPTGTGRSALSYDLDETGIWAIRIPRFYLPDGVEDTGTFEASRPTDLVIAPEGTDRAGYRNEERSEPRWCTPLLDAYNSERQPPYLLWKEPDGSGRSRP